MTETSSLPDALRDFVDREKWTFAKTMPLWPHEYIVRERVDEKLFVELMSHIFNHGYEGRFYKRHIFYFEDRGMIYWTMSGSLEEALKEGEIIINRTKKENSYESRLRNGTLPEQLEAARSN